MTEQTKRMILPIVFSVLTSVVVTGFGAWFTVIRHLGLRPTFDETRHIVSTEAPYNEDRNVLRGLPDQIGELSGAIFELKGEVAELRGELRASRPGGAP